MRRRREIGGPALRFPAFRSNKVYSPALAFACHAQDDNATATALFEFVNIPAHSLITQQKLAQAVYDSNPDSARQQIQRLDSGRRGRCNEIRYFVAARGGLGVTLS